MQLLDAGRTCDEDLADELWREEAVLDHAGDDAVVVGDQPSVRAGSDRSEFGWGEGRAGSRGPAGARNLRAERHDRPRAR
jgi:hypothetical protein